MVRLTSWFRGAALAVIGTSSALLCYRRYVQLVTSTGAVAAAPVPASWITAVALISVVVPIEVASETVRSKTSGLPDPVITVVAVCPFNVAVKVEVAGPVYVGQVNAVWNWRPHPGFLRRNWIAPIGRGVRRVDSRSLFLQTRSCQEVRRAEVQQRWDSEPEEYEERQGHEQRSTIFSRERVWLTCHVARL